MRLFMSDRAKWENSPQIPPSEASDELQPVHLNSIQSLDDLLVTPINDREERTLYNAYYDRIYPLIRENALNFDDLAEKTALPKRRLQESLLYRLGSGQVRQLFGHNEGYCNVCKNTLYSKKTTEPLCLKCLQQVDSYITHITGKQRPFVLNETVVPSPALHSLGLPTEAAGPHEGEGDTSPTESKTELKHDPFNADDILSILEDEEENLLDTTLSASEIELMLQSLQTGTLRHYGFKRIKKTGNTIARQTS